jgi:hypothetical protein
VRNLKNHAPYLFAFIPELKRITFDLLDRQHLVFETIQRDQLEAPRLAASVERVSASSFTTNMFF